MIISGSCCRMEHPRNRTGMQPPEACVNVRISIIFTIQAFAKEIAEKKENMSRQFFVL